MNLKIILCSVCLVGGLVSCGVSGRDGGEAGRSLGARVARLAGDVFPTPTATTTTTAPVPPEPPGSIRFRVSYALGAVGSEGQAFQQLNVLLAEGVGGLGALGYSGCALDGATVTMSGQTGVDPLGYSGAHSGSYSVVSSRGSATAEIACVSGPTPPPNMGSGQDLFLGETFVTDTFVDPPLGEPSEIGDNE